MKKYCFIFLAFLIICITSCSQVFEAGVSGRVVTKDSINGSEQGAADVYVYSYYDKSAYEKDLELFKNGEITKPSVDEYVPCTTTGENGQFTIDKIVWESNNGLFGKTADVAKLYLIFYHEDYEPCGYGPVSIISGSSNSSSVKQTIEQNRFPMPVFSSQIDFNNENTATTSTDNEYDNVRLILTDSEFKAYEGTGASVYTYSTEHGVDSLSYTHGHFTGLGAGLKWQLPEKQDFITVNIVWDINNNGKPDTGDKYYSVNVSKYTTGIPSKIQFD